MCELYMTWSELLALIFAVMVLRLIVTISEYDSRECRCVDRLCNKIRLLDGSIHDTQYTMQSNFIGVVKVKTFTLNGTQYCDA